MEQSYGSPFSHTSFLEEVYDPNKDEKIELWRSVLNALSSGKISWEKFLNGLSVSQHPAKLLSSSESGQSLLHLAVLSNRIDIAEEIISTLPQLKWRCDHLNWTPLELSRFLHRIEISRLLQAAPSPQFYDQPNVFIADREQFDTLSKLEYLPGPVFKTEAIFNEIVLRSKKAKSEDAIPPERIWMGIYFDKEIQTGTHPKVSIRYINDEIGFGVFAEQRIPSCAFVGEYRGIIQERVKKELKNKVHCVRYTVWEMGKRQFILDAETMGNFTRFINHSAKPNLSLQSVYWRGIPRMIFVALKEIPEGTQLTFDYGTFFWKEFRRTPVLFDND